MNLHSLSNPHALERQWIDEVRYLHSLWHQGPPQNPSRNLRPCNLPSFKKKKKQKERKTHTNTKKENKDQHLDLEAPSDPSPSNAKWPSELPPEPRPQTGWGNPIQHAAAPSTHPATAEDQAKLAAVRLQRSALKSCRDFFAKKNLSDSEDDDDDDEEEEEDEPMEDGEGESENFKFFLRIFSDDDDLRSYYEKNLERGEFFCLACGGIGEKIGKRFGNCVSLVQHSISISKTKGKNAHRAFGKAICRVLGWNVKRLPTIVMDLGKPLGESMAQAKSQEAGLGEDDATNQERTSQEAGLGEDDATNQEKPSQEAGLGKNDATDREKPSSQEAGLE